jgi:hypothetical protein
MSTDKTAGAKKTAAERAWVEATKHTAATAAEIDAAAAQITAAEQALAYAKAEAEAAIDAKAADPNAARERIQNAREAIKQAQDDLEWAQLNHQAAEVVNRQACEDEQAAHRRVIAEEYIRAQAEWKDPANKERQLLAQLTDLVAELTPLICARKERHSRLQTGWEYIPPDERPDLPHAGRLPAGDGSLLISVHIASVPVEVADAFKAGAAQGEARMRQ